MFRYLIVDIIENGADAEEFFGFLTSLFSVIGIIVCVRIYVNVKRAKSQASKGATGNRAGVAPTSEVERGNTTSVSKSGMTAEEWYDGVKRRRAEAQAKSKSKTSIEAELEKRHADHEHPAFTKNTRVEYVPTGGSLTAESEEGCKDLKNVRFIETDEDYAEDIDIDHDLTPLQAMMVFGDVISKPKFKK